MRLRQAWFSLTLLCALPAMCGAQGGPFHLRVVPQNASIPIGASRSYFFERFILKESPGVLVAGAQWTSTNPSVATIDPATGVVHAVALGSAIIYASSGPYHGSTRVNVGPVSLVSITVAAAGQSNPSITTGTIAFTATGNLSDGTTQDLTTTAVWSSSNPSVATISNTAGSQGVATAPGTPSPVNGTTVIKAVFGVLSGTTSLNVGLTAIAVSPTSAKISVGQLQPFTAFGTFTGVVAQQNISSSVNWSTNSCAFAVISNKGVAAGMAAGDCNISASSGTVTSNTAVLHVVPPPTLAAVRVVASSLTVSQGGSRQFSATGVYTDGSTKSLTNVSWFSSNPTIAPVNANGLVNAPITGFAAMAATITAVSGSISGSATLTVNPPPSLTSIVVTPASVVLAGGVTQQFTATGHYSDATTKDLTSTAMWSSTNTLVAVISTEGLAAAVGPGSTTITATMGAISGNATLQSLSVPRFVYVANNGDSTISTYGINSNTGQFVPLGYTFVGASAQPAAIAADPAGQFLYANTPGGTDSLVGYRINSTSGTLTPIAFSTGTTGLITGPEGVVVHPSGKFFYFVSNTGGNVLGFTINSSTGALAAIAGSPFTAGASAYAIALDPTGHFAYVANYVANTISEFNIDQATGALTPISSFASIACASNPISLAVHPTGKFVYCANYSANTITAFSVNGSGGLVALGSPLATGTHPQFVAIHPAGTFAYVANGAGSISAYSIDVNGNLHALAGALGNPYSAGSQPIALAMDPNGRGLAVANNGSNEVWVYGIDSVTGALGTPSKQRSRVTPSSIAVANGPTELTSRPTTVYAPDLQQAVEGYEIDPASGFLTLVPTLPLAPPATAIGWSPFAVAVDPLNRFFYVADQSNSGAMWPYSVDQATGALTLLSTTPTPADSQPWCSVVDPSGRFLYTTNEASASVTGYAIDQSTGLLTAITGSPYTTGTEPQGMKVDPSGRFLYVGNGPAGPSNVSAYSIDPATGQLTPTPGSPYTAGSNPADIAVAPSGQFVYVTNFNSNTISAYSVDANTGALTEITAVGSPFVTGQFPWGAAMDPAGQFLVAAGSTLYRSPPGDINVFRVDQASGALAPVPGSPFPGSSNPQSVSIDPSGSFVYEGDINGEGVSGFLLDRNTGDLAQIAGSPFTASGFGNINHWIVSTGSLAPPTPRLVFITVSSPVTSLAQGQQQQFTATGTFSDGSTQDFTNTAIWTASDSTIATVNQNGLVLGVSQGNAAVSASFNGVSGSLPMNVTALSLVSLSVAPSGINVPQGNTAQFTALGTFSDGTTQDLSSSVIWTSSNSAVATINSSGTATAISPTGSPATITATSGTLTATATMAVHAVATLSSVTVAPVNPAIPLGTSIQFAATAHYSDATTSDVTNLATWNSGAPSVATISNTQGTIGLASSVSGGNSNITAVFGGKTSTPSILTVAVPTLVSISVSPNPAFIPLNHPQQFTASGTYSDGSTQTLTTAVIWSSSSTSIVTISNTAGSQGLATGKGIGNATITATLGSVSGTAKVSGIF